MKKIISSAVVSTLLLTTTFSYAEEEQLELDEKLRINQEQQEELDDRIIELNTKIEETEDGISNILKEIQETNETILLTQMEMENLLEEIDYNEELLGERIKVINNNYSLEYIKIILSSTSITDFFNNIYMVQEIVEQDKELLARLNQNRIDIENKQEVLDEIKNQQEMLKASLEEENIKLETEKQEVTILIAELEKEEEELEEEIRELAAKSQISHEYLGVLTSGSWPVPGYSRISSPYGYRIHPVTGVYKMHGGIDVPAPIGTPITSFDDGKVIFSGTQSGYGNTVMIQHPDGKVTLYAHNSQNLVSVGQTVSKGQAIAKMGSTGMSTGSHLHFEIRINGNHVNPMLYIN